MVKGIFRSLSSFIAILKNEKHKKTSTNNLKWKKKDIIKFLWLQMQLYQEWTKAKLTIAGMSQLKRL